MSDTPLACPRCREGAPAHALSEGWTCAGCGERWAIERGLLRCFRDADVRGTDRLMRVFYDGLPRFHDPLTTHLLPLLQGEGTEAELRDAYMRRLALRELEPRASGAPGDGGASSPSLGSARRLLDVGIGAGASLPLIARDAPDDVALDAWGVDVSRGMLACCERRISLGSKVIPKLVWADAHELPFASASFDRVLHVGAMGSFRDPRAALREMVRVAKPGARVVVVDEELDPSRAHPAWVRATFRLLTFYDRAPHAPIEHLPPGIRDLRVERASRFYYCMSFVVA